MAAPPVPLATELEADQIGTSDYAFRRIGEAVPLKPSDSAFDLANPPPLPLAIADRHGALFLAHSHGFLVARTRDVIGVAKEVKEKGKGEGRCVEGVSVVDVRIGRVEIVAVSGDQSTLAAVVERELRLYSVASLLDKVQEPLVSYSLDGASTIKDFKWRKSGDKSFVFLSNTISGESFSSHGPMKLYRGSLKDQPKDVMVDIDAVEWSMEGDFVAVARKNTVTILSHDLKEQHSMSLLFKSWPDESGLDCDVKVDSINWVTANSIVVGCLRVDEDGNEDGYLVQVITTRKDGLGEKSCMPVVYSFPDLFGSIADDQLPAGGGPYLLSSFLDRWKILLASNKKAVDNHVVLLQLLADDKAGEVVSLEFQNDMSARIDLQENDDDNFILGLGVDKVSVYEKVRLQVGSAFEERSPYCILMCLTCEGKLIMFHAVRISESYDLPSVNLPHPDAESTMPNVKVSHITKEVRDGYTGKEFPSANLERTEVVVSSITPGKADQVGGFIQGTNKNELPVESSMKSVQDVNFSYSGFDASSTLVAGNMSAEVSAMTRSNEMSKGLGSIGTLGASAGLQSTGGLPGSVGPSVKSPELSFSTILSNTRGQIEIGKGEKLPSPSDNRILSASAHQSPTGGPFSLKESIKKPSSSVFSSKKDPPIERPPNSVTRTGAAESVPSFQRSSVITQEDSFSMKSHFPSMQPQPVPSSTFKPPQILNSEPEMSKQSSSVFSSKKEPPIERSANSVTRTGAAESIPSFQRSSVISKEDSFSTKSHFPSMQPQPALSSTFKSPQILNSEPEMSKQFNYVKDMVKELDALLSSIEQEGGFKDSCAVLQRSSLVTLEENLENIFEMSRKCQNEVEEKLMKIQQIQHKMLQISSRQVYVEGLLKQASNDQYWDIWNRQKLSPEFELKRDNILNAYENLKSQLIELERHFDSLEINRFGETGRFVTGRRASQRSLEPSRQTQSLHSLYNTLSSQLAAAQQLSECLSEQMAVLNLNSPSVRRQNVAKELFESIGLTHEDSAVQSPDIHKRGSSPECIRRVPPSRLPSKAIKEHSRGNTSSALKSAAPNVATRRRDSLDRSLLSFEPQKTTVKRMLQGRVRDSEDTPFRTPTEASSLQIERSIMSQARSNEAPAVSSHSLTNKFRTGARSPEIHVKPSKQVSSPPTNSELKWPAKDSFGSSHPPGSNSDPMQAVDIITRPSFSLKSSPSIFSVTHNNAKGSSGFPDMTNTGISHVGGQSTSSAKSATVTKTAPYTQFGTSVPIQASSPERTSPTGKGQISEQSNTDTGGWGLTSSLQRSTKDRGQSGEPLNPRTGEGGLSRLSDKGSVSALSPVSAAAFAEANQSSGNYDIISKRNDATETLSTVSKGSAPTTSFLFTPSTSSTSSIISTPVKPSPVPTLFSTVAVEGSSIDIKTIRETCESDSVFPSESVASSQSTSSSPKLSPFKSQTQPNLTSLGERSISQPLPTHSIDASRTAEPTFAQTPPSKVSRESKEEPAKSEVQVKEISGGLDSKRQPDFVSTNICGLFPATSSSSPVIPSVLAPTTTSPTASKDGVDMTSNQEDEMEEEAPDTTSMLNFGGLGGFGLGSAPPSSAPKSNPFGGSFVASTASSVSSLPSHTASPDQLFRPASFNIPSVQPIQQVQAVNSSGPTGGFSGFGQPAQLGAGQQALGSVLGSFGQSRQLGAGVPGFGFTPAVGFGGSGVSASGNNRGLAPASGFGGAASGGGFSSLASSGGGFAAAAARGSGFAAAASGGGFSGAAQGGGFAAAAQGGGFAAAAQGGGFGGATQGGGFAGSAQGGGFAGAAQGGGFGTAATGGGFAGAAQGGGFGGGFGSANSGVGGFSAAASVGGGFGAAAPASSFGAGGFGAFGSNQGGGFSAFGGGSTGTGRPPAELLTQMRK